MNYWKNIAACSALVLIAVTAYASDHAFVETRTAREGRPAPEATVDELAWLAGSWIGEGLGGTVREVYSPPMGGIMTGHFIYQRGDEPGFFEILSIAEVDGSLVYRLKHFNPDLTGWEEKGEVVEFPLVDREDDAFFFNGLTIRKEGEDGMVAAVRIDRGDAGIGEAVFRYRREQMINGPARAAPAD